MSEELDQINGLKLIAKIRNRRVLVLGDLMLDRYWWGTVHRISPEAPVPVVLKQRSTTALGGAANVARNIRSLGGEAWLIGTIGADSAGTEFKTALTEAGLPSEHLVVDANRATTVKTRIVAHNQHVVRVDEESTSPLSSVLGDQIVEQVKVLLPLADCMVISDYAKGLLVPGILKQVIGAAAALRKPVLIDPKGLDYTRYEGATVLSPNRFEVLTAAGFHATQVDSVLAAVARLFETVRVESILVTEGEAGMTLFERAGTARHTPTRARVVYDVTGAGDTVVAALGLALAAGAGLWQAAQLANLAAGLAVEQLGTAAVKAEQLAEALQAGRLG